MSENVAVFFGGKAPEHDISVITGVLTVNTIDKALYAPVPVYVSREGEWYTGENLNKLSYYKSPDISALSRVFMIAGDSTLWKKTGKKIKAVCKIDCAINCMHGLNGEDGSLCGLLQLSMIPLASPDMFASAAAIDKDFSKIVLKGLDVDYIPYVRVFRDNYFEKKVLTVKYIGDKLGFPIIVKPARLGSSIGIKKAEDENELHAALVKAFGYDNKVICEKYVRNAKDINCAVYRVGNEIHTSELEQPITANDILTFSDKYTNVKAGGASKNFPADIGEDNTSEIKETAAKIYRKLDFCGIVRFDFLIIDNHVYLNEMNTVPGSLAYYLFCRKISEFTVLITGLIEDAKRRFRAENNLNYIYESRILFAEGLSLKK